MELLELGIQPISQEHPVGTEARYEKEYEQLQGEIDRLSIPSATKGSIDWDNVVKLGTLILSEKSKDIIVGSYLAAGLMEKNGVEGFSAGIKILTDLVTNFWDKLFPPRLRGRLNAFEWWMKRVDIRFGTKTPNSLKEQTLNDLRAALEKLDSVLVEKTEDAPKISRVLEMVNLWPVASETGEPASTQPESGTASRVNQSASASASAAAEVAQIPKDPDQLVDFGMKQLLSAADLLLQKDIASPLPYHLLRIANWFTLDRLPMADGQKTPIPPPASTIRQVIEGFIANKEYKTAVIESEAKAQQFLFWLDPSRWTAEVLGRMGSEYKAAQEAIGQQTSLFVKRLSGVEKLTFSDGTPFADNETRSWINDLTKADGAPEQMVMAPGLSPADVVADVTAALEKAMLLAKEKKVNEAVMLLQEPLTRASSGQVRLRWRMALAQLFIAIGQPELAQLHARELLGQLDRYALEEFDPDLALSVLRIVFKSFNNDKQENAQAVAAKTLDRIARISPLLALSIYKS
jgi:type VI secretion system protein VasJ